MIILFFSFFLGKTHESFYSQLPVFIVSDWFYGSLSLALICPSEFVPMLARLCLKEQKEYNFHSRGLVIHVHRGNTKHVMYAA